MISDAELATGLRDGDERALDALLGQRWSRLVAYLHSRLGDLDLAKDIAQDAFVALWDNRRKIDPDRSVVAYLYQIARRLTIDERRRNLVRRRWEDQQAAAGPAATADDQLRNLADREALESINRSIARLPDRQREAFTLVHVHQLSYREAAEVMGSATQTVANQVAAALATLRRNLTR